MRAGQRIARLRVVEVLFVYSGSLPVGGRMALHAIGSKSPLMLVFMANGASGREAHPGAIQVLGRERRTRRGGNVLRTVAGAAANAGVLAVEHVPGLRVVESLGRGLPVNHLKLHSVVIRVAFDAGRARWSRARKGSMKPLVLLQFVRDLAMAFDAAEGRRFRRNFMTLDAASRSVQGLVRTGKRARRNLRIGHPTDHQEEACDAQNIRTNRQSEPAFNEPDRTVHGVDTRKTASWSLPIGPPLFACSRFTQLFPRSSLSARSRTESPVESL